MRKNKMSEKLMETLTLAKSAKGVIWEELLNSLFPRGITTSQNLFRAKSNLTTAVQTGLIEMKVSANGKKYLSLTEAGRQRLSWYKLQDYKIVKPSRWDGKWRLYIFDIKEVRRSSRDYLRNCLRRIGFVRLQNSVWVYPYDCPELMLLIKTGMGIGKDALYLVVESIENDRWLRNEFSL